MGKSKGSQRTKGNTKPSSSGHSAELLGSGSSSVGFVGFGSCKIDPHVAQSSDSKVDGTFSMVMKKMTKRDTTTKLKAVQEFRDLCVDRDRETVLGVLAFWPRLYNKLALDFDRRVREAIQDANAKLLDKVKRDIAPYLKNIMAVWLLSQNDPHHTAASIARSTFESLFPTEKQSDALIFCKEEILVYFKENLFELTIQSLSEPNVEPEEIEHKYILIVSGTLLGLKLFISTAYISDRNALFENIKNIIGMAKFWKLARSKHPQIRVAWYNLVSSLCCNMRDVFSNMENKLGCAILGCLSESNATVAVAIWEASLHYVANCENCWENLDVHKVVLPELWTLLKGGGKGNASLIYPCLLPFISKLPLKIVKQKPNFFQDFFSSITNSLFLDSVKNSTSECDAIVTAYIECLQYTCFSLNHGDDHSVITEVLLCNQLLDLVEKSFSAEGSHLPVSKFYPMLGTLVKTVESSVTCSSTYNQFMTDFANRVVSVSEKIVNDSEHASQHADLVFLAYFFHCMHEPTNFLGNKKKVKPSEQQESLFTHENQSNSSAEVSTPQRHHLFSCTVKVCYMVLQKLQTRRKSFYVKLLAEILSAARCCEIFDALLDKSVFTTSTKEAPFEFFENIVLTWLAQEVDNHEFLESIVDITYIVCSCTESALQVLNSCIKVESSEFLRRMLYRGITVYENDKLFSKWLRTPEFATAVIQLFKLVSDAMIADQHKKKVVENVDSYINTLQACLFRPSYSAFTLETCYYREILSVMNSSLQKFLQAEKNIPVTVITLKFMCNTAKAIFYADEQCWNLSVGKSLMLAFIDLYFCVPLQSYLDAEVREEIINLWKLSIKMLPVIQKDQEAFSTYITEAALRMVDSIMRDNDSNIPQPTLEFFSSGISSLINESETNQESNTQTQISNSALGLVENFLPTKDAWIALRRNLKMALFPAFLEKKLFYPLPEERITFLVPNDASSIISTARKMSDIVLHFITFNEVIAMKSVVGEILSKQLFNVSWMFSYCANHGFLEMEGTPGYGDAFKLQKNCFQILSFLYESDSVIFVNNLLERAAKDPTQWLLAFDGTVGMLKTQHATEDAIFHNLYCSVEHRDSSGHLWTSQALIHYLPIEMKENLLLESVAEFRESLKNRVNMFTLAVICCCVTDTEVLGCSTTQSSLFEMCQDISNAFRSHHLAEDVMDSVTPYLNFLFSEIVRNCPDVLFPLIEFIMSLSTSSASKCNQKSDKILTTVWDLANAYHCFSLICNLLASATQDSKFTDQLDSTKKDTFLSDISVNLMNIFLGISGSCHKVKQFHKSIESVFAALSAALEFIAPEMLLKSLLSISEQIDTLMEKKLLPLLTSTVFSLQLGAHSILAKIMPLFPSTFPSDENKEETEVKELDQNKKLLPFLNSLLANTQIVDCILSDVRIGDNCIIIPRTDSYTYTLAFLFEWSEFLEFFVASDVQERSSCVSYFEKDNVISSVLSSLFRLLPESISALCASLKCDKEKEALAMIFLEPPLSSYLDAPSKLFMQHVACNTYYNTLKKMPAVVRSWCRSLDKRSLEAVSRFTSKYVSVLLAAREIQAVMDSDAPMANIEVQARPATREVAATYTIDSCSVELTIQLPSDFPLGPLTIERHGSMKINQAKWRQQHMQLTSFLMYQNGSVLEGLLLWKKNLDKAFEGHEECLICYFIVHSGTSELPRATCRQCKKKFHSSCIHKWFVTSNNSTCPFCRQLWF